MIRVYFLSLINLITYTTYSEEIEDFIATRPIKILIVPIFLFNAPDIPEVIVYLITPVLI